MSGAELFKRMAEHINHWTLRFTDPEQEKMYQEFIDTKQHIPLPFSVATYSIIVIQFGYRVLAIYSSYSGHLLLTGTFLEELITFLFVIACIGLEVLFRAIGRCPQLRGFCLYICLPIASIGSSFYTQKVARLGLLYVTSTI
jgi:hypothetical protein